MKHVVILSSLIIFHVANEVNCFESIRFKRQESEIVLTTPEVPSTTSEFTTPIFSSTEIPLTSEDPLPTLKTTPSTDEDTKLKITPALTTEIMDKISWSSDTDENNSSFVPLNGVCKTADGEEGRCISIKKCKTLLDLLITIERVDLVKKKLKKYHCGFDGQFPAVCCEGVDLKSPPEPVFDDIYNHLPVINCGISKVSPVKRTINGLAPLNAWPWLALIGYIERRKENLSWLCLGTLVTNRHILTTAICITRKRPVVVRLGEHILKSDDDDAYPENILINNTYPFPAYRSRKVGHDLGVILLNEQVYFSDGIKPICLPFITDLKFKNYTDSKSYIAGWGSSNFGDKSESRPSHLTEGTVLVRSTEECKNIYDNKTKFNSFTINESFICAGGGPIDSCQGDGGGPLMVEEDGKVYIIGIVSAGYKCGVVGYPGIYTNVRYYLDWIAANTVYNK